MRPALFVLGLTALACQAQMPAPLDLAPNYPLVRLSPTEAIHADDDPNLKNLASIQQLTTRIRNGNLAVALKVIVGLNGRIESATPISGPQRFYAQAIEIEDHRVFAPIRDSHGDIVRARFTDSVYVYPPERWSQNPPAFPETVDLKSFSLTLERSCDGVACPTYSVTITGTGEVTFTDRMFSAIPGTHHATLSREAVLALIDQVNRGRFLAALDDYSALMSDASTATLTLSISGLHKKVTDYAGLTVGLPETVQRLENAVDTAADTQRWTQGNANTFRSLQAEHWSFAPDNPANGSIFLYAIHHRETPMIAMFLAAKYPIAYNRPDAIQPICYASSSGNQELVERMLAQQPASSLPPGVVDECLTSAAQGGDTNLVSFWLDHGAAVNPSSVSTIITGPGYQALKQTPLRAAVLGVHLDVVEQLLAAHADVSTAHNNGTPLVAFALAQLRGYAPPEKTREESDRAVRALIAAGANVNDSTPDQPAAILEINGAPELLPDLLAAGADINARNGDGATPLMIAKTPDLIRALLAAGADPTARTKKGETTEQMLQWFSCGRCAKAFTEALSTRAAARQPDGK